MGRPENEIRIDGTIGKDAEVNTTSSGYKYAKFSICQNSSKKNKTTGQYDIANWYDCVFWPKTDKDENDARQLVKGARIKVIGRLEMDYWDDKTTGKKRSKTYILVDSIQFNERTAPRYEEPSRGREPYQNPEEIPF